ncbi:MAG: radical SAM protein [Nanoarchaeota archaeon]|nr:radical SAM protein [Nanoarchaeota archaeon]
MTKKVVLVTMPFIKPTSPPLGISNLKSFVESRSDVKVKCIDINLLFHSDFAEYLRQNKTALNEREKIIIGFYDFIKKKENLGNLDKLNLNITEFLEGFEELKEKVGGVLKDFIKGQRDDLAILDKYAEVILNEKPDIVGFSICYNENFIPSLTMAKRLKRLNPNVKILFGGSYLSLVYDKLSKILGEVVDYIVYNQGEMALLELVKGTDIESIPNIIYKKEGEIIKNKEDICPDLNKLPFADFSDFKLNDYFAPFKVLPVLFSKGCYWKRCAFCVHHHSYSNTYKAKDVDGFVEELEHYNREYGVEYFYFVDEMISATQFDKIALAIIQKGLKIYYYALVKPTKDFSYEILKKMYDSGCRCLLLGIESGNQRILDLMGKGTKVEDVEVFLKLSSKAGIKNGCFFILGFPSESLDELEDTKKFIIRNKEFIGLTFYGKFVLEKDSSVFLNPEKFGIRIKEIMWIDNKYNYENINGVNVNNPAYDDAMRFLSKLNGNKQGLVYLRDIMLMHYSDQNVL